MAKYQRNKRRPLAEINVVPYIDVMLVLLVIFMITAPLLTQGVSVNLPEAKAKVLSDENQLPIIVTVDAKGQYYLNIANNPHQPITPQALTTRVAAQLEIAKRRGMTQQVMVKGDKDVDYGKVVTAMVMLQKAGAKTVGLMTEPPRA